MISKIVVVGSEGQLASELRKWSAQNHTFHFTFMGKSDMNLLEKDWQAKLIGMHADVVINTAAYTQVDKAESEVQSCVLLNTIAPAQIAKICASQKIPLIHISTDYVYDSLKNIPLLETHPTQPKSVYGISKLNGEKLISQFHKNFIIIRTSWLYSIFGQNFLKTMLRLSTEKNKLQIVNDQFGAPTHVADLANVIMQIVNHLNTHPDFDQWGVYNFANEGFTSWSNFAKYIFEQKNKDVQIKGISTENYNAPAPRPAWSVLNLDKIKTTFGTQILHWQEAVNNCLSQI